LDRMQEALSRIAPTRRTPLGMVVEIANDSFRFDFDKSTLRAENRELLSRVAGVLLASSGYRLYVYGHTDDIGTDEHNQALSERRAQAVADYLVEAGVPGDIVSTRGYGKSSPRVKAATGDARQQNRRVEIGIVDTIIKYHGAAHARQP
jgi:outer membrane protein OmpA-like peptidoglycan-associated protein